MKFRNTKLAMVILSSFFILGSAYLSFTDTIHGEVAYLSPQEMTVKSYDDTYYN
ncbi:ribonuclease, partial [Bacillus toyonensis]